MIWLSGGRRAGVSAQRRFRNARREWRRAIRVPLFVVVGALGMVAVLPRVFSPWHPVFDSGLVCGAAIALFVAIWDEPPQFIAKWGRGAEGERRTAKALRPLKRSGWHVRHDLACGR